MWLTSYWNWIDLASCILNVAFIVCDFEKLNPIRFRGLGAACISLAYLKLFYYLKLFSPTSNMIRMIIEVTLDMLPFFLVLIIAMISWGNIFYILDYNAFQV